MNRSIKSVFFAMLLIFAGCAENEHIANDLFGDESGYVEFEKFTFLAMHPMLGGINIWINGNQCEVQISRLSDIESDSSNQSYQFSLTEEDLRRIKFLLWSNQFDDIKPKRFEPVPGELVLTIEITSVTGERKLRSMLSRDFDRRLASIMNYLELFACRAELSDPVEECTDFPFENRNMSGFDSVEEITQRSWSYLHSSATNKT